VHQKGVGFWVFRAQLFFMKGEVWWTMETPLVWIREAQRLQLH